MKIRLGETVEVKELPQDIFTPVVEMTTMRVTDKVQDLIDFAFEGEGVELDDPAKARNLVEKKGEVFTLAFALNRLKVIKDLLHNLDSVETKMRDKIGRDHISNKDLVQFHQQLLQRLEKELNFYSAKEKEGDILNLFKIDARTINASGGTEGLKKLASEAKGSADNLEELSPESRKKIERITTAFVDGIRGDS